MPIVEKSIFLSYLLSLMLQSVIFTKQIKNLQIGIEKGKSGHMDNLSKLIELSTRLDNEYIQKWKQQGRKVVGFFCSYIPEEIIYAADILPYRIRPAGCTQTKEADVYMSNVNCTFAKCCLDYGLGEEFSFLDGLVSMNSCDHVRRVYDIWRLKKPLPFMHFLSVPHSNHERAIEWYKDELTIFKDAIENHFGVSVTPAKLEKAIEIYNRTRKLIRKLSEVMKQDFPPITGTEYLNIILASFVTPKEQYNQLLEGLLEEIKLMKAASDFRVRLMLIGSAFDQLDFAKIIEDSNGRVVTDTLCFGSQFYYDIFEGDSDLMGALTKFYLNKASCPRFSEAVKERLDFIEEKIREFRVDGVIYQRIRYCNLWGGEAFLTAKKLEEIDIPFINLEREYYPTALGALRTRIEAFLERIVK
jgi:benzoyl-CoA reductase/2-hydroxyglutaryl-CoA dehydratase subunit BcrC/BadD/HgdB